jgi:hypothetical protein
MSISAPSPRLAPLVAAVFLQTACMASKGDGTGVMEYDSAPDDDKASYLRVDVYPSVNDGTADTRQAGAPRPQTFLLNENWIDLAITLADSIVLSGVVSGFDASPHATVTVPGQTVPVSADVSVWREGTIMEGGALSGTDGAFSFPLTPGAGYTFAVVPQDPAELPFVVQTDQSFDQTDHTLDVTLDYAAPVYGRVTTGIGQGLMGVKVDLTDPDNLVTGASTVTDVGGWYMLRATPGSYTICFHGSEGSYIPTLGAELEFEDSSGARVDEDYASLDFVSTQGTVTSGEGEAENNATVRFTATSLDAYPDGNLTVETDTDRNGRFSANLLPGNYRVEYIPAYGRAISPYEDRIEVLSGSAVVDLGERRLGDFTSVHLDVLDSAGVVVPNVMVVATETTFENESFRGTTDAQGNLEMDLPDTTFTFTFTPPGTSLAAVTRVVTTPAGLDQTVQLAEGRTVSGTVTNDGNPVPYAVVEFRDEIDVLYASTLTDAEGAFSTRVDWQEP